MRVGLHLRVRMTMSYFLGFFNGILFHVVEMFCVDICVAKPNYHFHCLSWLSLLVCQLAVVLWI